MSCISSCLKLSSENTNVWHCECCVDGWWKTYIEDISTLTLSMYVRKLNKNIPMGIKLNHTTFEVWYKWYIYQNISIISIVSKIGYPRQLPVCPPLPTGFSPAWWTFTGPSNPWPGSTPPTPTCSRWPSCPSSSLRYKHRGPGAETGDLHRAQAVLTTWRGSTTHTASRGRRPRPPRGWSETRGCCAPPARLQHKMLWIPFVTWPSLVCSL